MFGIDITLLDELYKYHTNENIYCLNTIKTDKEYELIEIYKEHLKNIMCPIFQKKEDNSGHIITMEWKEHEKKKEYDSNQLIIDNKYIHLQQGQNCLVYSFFALILGNIFKDLKTGYKILIALKNTDEDSNAKSKILNKLVKYNKLIKSDKTELKTTLTKMIKQNKSLNLEMNFGKLLRKTVLNLKVCQKATAKENIEELKAILSQKEVTAKEIRKVLLQYFYLHYLENKNFNWINFIQYFENFIDQLIKIKEDKIDTNTTSLDALYKFITGNENDHYEQIISIIPYQIGTTIILPNFKIQTLLTIKNTKYEILPICQMQNKEIKAAFKNMYKKQNIIEIIENNKLKITENNQIKEYNLKQNNEQVTTMIIMISMITNYINEAEQIWQKCRFNLHNPNVKNIFIKIFEHCILEKWSKDLLYKEIINLVQNLTKNTNNKAYNESQILQSIYQDFYKLSFKD